MEFALQKTVCASEVKLIRGQLKMKQKELAGLMNVSVKTVEHWESSNTRSSVAAAAMLCILRERPWLLEELEIPEREFPLRLRYLNQNRLCTIIDVNDREQRVKIKNYVTDPLYRAFGKNEHPHMKSMKNFWNQDVSRGRETR